MSRTTRKRLQASILLASLVGAATGLVVAGLHKVMLDIAWLPLARRSDWWIAALPVAELILSMATAAA